MFGCLGHGCSECFHNNFRIKYQSVTPCNSKQKKQISCHLQGSGLCKVDEQDEGGGSDGYSKYQMMMWCPTHCSCRGTWE